MVRVISVHHFTSQDVSSIPKPIASTIAGKYLLVSTENHQIQVHNLEKSTLLSHSFQTLDKAIEVVHSSIGNYVVTLEGSRDLKEHNEKNSGSGTSVRVYINWDDPKVDGAPIRPRIATRVTPCTQPSQGASLDMIEFPQREKPLQIAVCPSTGNLMMAFSDVLVIYKYTVKSHEPSKTKYVDFIDCIHVFHKFTIPKQVALCEDVVGCLSSNQVHIFKIRLVDCSQDERNRRSISLYSVSSESESSSSLDPLSSLFVKRSNSNGTEKEEDHEQSIKEDKEGERGICIIDGTNTVVKNVTIRRHQDSEMNDVAHLDGYVGNVKRHPQHVFFDTNSSENSSQSSYVNGQNSIGKIHLSDIERANKEHMVTGTPGIMEQKLGPTILSGGFGLGFASTEDDVIVKLVPTTSSAEQDFMIEAEAISLIHCKLLPSEEEHEVFDNLILKPVYWSEFRLRQSKAARNSASPVGRKDNLAFGGGRPSIQNHPLQSNSYQHMMSLTMCFTSQSEGYLYHVPGHLRKPGRGCGVRRIATYPFTAPVGRIALEPTLLHALTQTGLETYTLRSGYHTVQEAENLNEINNACPGSDTPICLVGLRPFIASKHLIVSGSHLVLLASAEQDTFLNPTLPPESSTKALVKDQLEPVKEKDAKWTVYSLSLPNPISLYKDMIQLANMNRALSPHGYFQLLCEAHMVLRTSIHDLGWKQLMSLSKSDKVNDTNLENELASTKDRYHESCLLLANAYILSHELKESKLALPYYRMSNLPAISILQTAMELWKKSKSSSARIEKHHYLPPGLIHYIDQLILKPLTNGNENIQESSLADVIIDILGEHAISELSYIILKSPSFRGFKTTKIHNYIKNHLSNQPRPEAKEAMSFALLCIDMGEKGIKDLEQARKYLQLSSPTHLSQVCIDYYHFLIDTGISSMDEMESRTNIESQCETFSDVAILIRDSVPEIFVEVLVSLIKADKLMLGSVLGLFINSFVSMSSIADHSRQASDCSVTHNTAMLQLFLETYFQELLHDNRQHSLALDEDQTQALHTLVRSYLTSLSVPVRFIEKNVDSNIFGPRRLYLDKLPPFESCEKVETEMLEADSPEFWCQNSLLKLQSLLCSPICLECEASLHEIVTNYLSVKQETIGSVSLRLLCCESQEDEKEKKAVNILVDNNPDVLIVYAKERDFGMKGWSILLKVLQDRLNNDDENEELHESWYASMQEILDHLAQTLTLEAFLEVLPSNSPQNNEEFQCHIQMCRKNQQAHQIQSLIVSTGNKLLSTLTL